MIIQVKGRTGLVNLIIRVQVIIFEIWAGDAECHGERLLPVSRCRHPILLKSLLGIGIYAKPQSEYSPQPPTENGGFDDMSNLASLVEYEVILSVMEWAADEDGQRLSPGSVYISEIAKSLRANQRESIPISTGTHRAYTPRELP